MKQVDNGRAGGHRMNDLRHECHSFSRDSGGSGHGFGEGLAYGPRVESGAIPAHGLVAGHTLQYSEGDRFGPTEKKAAVTLATVILAIIIWSATVP